MRFLSGYYAHCFYVTVSDIAVTIPLGPWALRPFGPSGAKTYDLAKLEGLTNKLYLIYYNKLN